MIPMGSQESVFPFIF